MVNILIAEDERVVAEDIQKSLQNLGYTVSAVVSSGEEALEKSKESDLVLMDIVLKGKMDGIEAAEHINSRFNIPVVYVTAYADEKTLQRAKVTEPYGYILKPFEDRELHAAIELALYKHKIEKTLQSEKDRLQALIDELVRTESSIDIAGSDYEGFFQTQLLGEQGGDVTRPVYYEPSRRLTQPCSVHPAGKAIETGTIKSPELSGSERRNYEVISVPLPDLEGYSDRVAEVVTDITECKQTEMQLKKLFEASKLINSTMDMEEIFTFISDSYQGLVGFDNFMIFLVSEDKTHIYPAYVSGGIKDKAEDVVLHYGEGLVGYCIKAREPIFLRNVKEKGEKTPGVNELFTSQIVVPLLIERECVGAIHISRTSENMYNENDVDVLKSLSEVISSAVRNSQLYHKIRELGLNLERRIKRRSERIEILLDTRQNLQKERSWERGLTIIIDSMRRLGFERCGVFLVNPMRKTLDSYGTEVQHSKQRISFSLKDTEYFGARCVLERRTIHVKEYNPKEGKQITSETNSSVWVPIIVQDEAFAALAADNIESKITEEDVKDLEILASMCAAFIDRTRLLVEPVSEKKLETEFRHWLDPSEGYILIEKKPVKSFETFVDLVTHGIPGFIISREYPERLRRKYKLVRTPMLWLSRSERENTISPDDLPKLNYIIEDFTRKSSESVILLDGLEYLIIQTSFEKVLKYVQEMKDIAVLNNSRLVIPFHKDTLSSKEYSILEKEFKML